MVRQEDIWLPDVIVSNSVTAQKQLGYDELSVRISSSGDIEWDPSTLIHSSCSIDITYYPFDTQVCQIDFATAVSKNTEVDVNIDQTIPIDISDYSEDGQWELIDTYAENLSDEDSKTKIRFSLLLKRRRTFFIVNIILPVIILSITASLVFALPADAGEKMGMGITVLLAYAVYLTIVASYLPSTSVQISILALYLTILLGITAFGIVISVFILRLHHKPNSEEVGPKVTALTLLLRQITCSSKNKGQHKEAHSKNSVAPETKRNSHDGDENVGYSPPSDPPFYREPMTWQDVAKAVDWFLFWTFTILTTLVTILCLCALAIGAEINAPELEKVAVF